MSQSQSQTVHVHLHKKTYSQKTQSHVHKKTTSTPVSAIPFVPPLPMYHPLNNNVPYSSFSATVPINTFTNHAVPLVNHATPQPYGTVPHSTPQPHVTSSLPLPQTHGASPYAPPHLHSTPSPRGVLHGTQDLFLPHSPLHPPESSGFQSAGSVNSGGKLRSVGTYHSSAQSLSSVSSGVSTPQVLPAAAFRKPKHLGMLPLD